MGQVPVNIASENPIIFALPQIELMLEWETRFGQPAMTPMPITLTQQQMTPAHTTDWQGLIPCARLDAFRNMAVCGTTFYGAASQLPTMARVLADFGITGTYKTKFHGGRAYIVFKGRPGLRTFFKGTRYLANNPMIVNIAAGRAAVRANVIKSMRLGGVLTIVVFGGAALADQIARNEVDLSDLGVTFATDIVKYMASTAITAGLATLATAGSVVVLPGAVLLVGAIVINIGLEYLDQRFQVTATIKKTINEFQMPTVQRINRGFNRFEREFIWKMVGPQAYNAIYGR